MDQEPKIEPIAAEQLVEQDAQSKVAQEAESPVAQPIKQPKSGGFPSWVDLLAILGLFFLAQFIAGVVAVAMGWQLSMPENMSELTSALQRVEEVAVGRSTLLFSIIAQPLMLLFVLLYRAVRRGGWGYVRFSVNGFNPSVLLLGVVLLFSLVIIMEPLLRLLPNVEEPEGRGLYMILALLVVAPVFEELLCRGVILSAMRERYNAWIGCVVSALIFALMHVELQAVVNAFVLGLLLGYVYLRTNSIFAPIILHSINNIFAYLFMIFGVAHLSLIDVVGPGALYTMIYCSAVGIMLLSMISISRRMNGISQADKARKLSDVK